MKHRAITATIETRTALHVGSGEASEQTDSLLRRSAAGELIIPGSALAGPLRALATRLAPRLDARRRVCLALRGVDGAQACDCLACRLFGALNPGDDETAGGRASAVFVADARWAGGPAPLIRDGVGIDRATETAARRERVKFDQEVLPPGSRFSFLIEWEDIEPEAERLLAAVLAEWVGGRGALGGRTARGLGGFDLVDMAVWSRDLDDPDELDAFLRAGADWWLAGPGDSWPAAAQEPGWLGNQLRDVRVQPVSAITQVPPRLLARSWAQATLTLRGRGPFLTNDQTMAGISGFDHAPVLQTYGIDGEPVLPGSGLRGPLRAQAERIARTITTVALDGQGNSEFLRRCPACDPLVSDTRRPLASCAALLEAQDEEKKRRIAERAEAGEYLCLACRLFGSTWLGSRLRVEDGRYLGADRAARKVQDFLAVDRFTGGGKDSAKFDAVVLWQPTFAVRLFLENPEPWELGWLALVLRDLKDGLVPVGFGKSKGFGAFELAGLELELGALDGDDAAALGLPEEDRARLERAERAGSAYRSVAWAWEGDGLAGAWERMGSSWASEFVRRAQAFDRRNEMRLAADTYWGAPGDPAALYPAEVKGNG